MSKIIIVTSNHDRFVTNLRIYHEYKNDEVKILPDININPKLNVDLIYVPDRDCESYPVNENVLYYKHVFNNYSSVDPKYWGPKLSFLQTDTPVKDHYTPVKAIAKEEVVDRWFDKIKKNSAGEDYLLFIYQQPDDERLKLYSKTSMQDALFTTLAYSERFKKRLIVTGCDSLKTLIKEFKYTEYSDKANISNSSHVITCNSNIAFEALLYQKPLICFGDMECSRISAFCYPFWSSLERTIRKNEFKIDQYKNWLYNFTHHLIDSEDINSYKYLEKIGD